MELNQRQRIEILLRTTLDARETLQRGDAGGKFQPESREFEMPAVWKDGDYEELVSCAEKLHSIAPGHYKHLAGRYFAAERKVLTLCERKGDLYDVAGSGPYWISDRWFMPNAEILRIVAMTPAISVRARRDGQLSGGDARLVRVLVSHWPEWVEARMAVTGVDFLCWTMPQKPRIPQAIYKWVTQGFIKVAA